jgi:hypothetical protein
MNEEYEKIYHRCPNLYKYRRYIECGPGWSKLIGDLSDKIEQLIIDMDGPIDEKPYVTQIKEKHGTLCFYMSSANDEMWALIEKAECDSQFICEVTGKPGTLQERNGWWSVRA